MQLSANGLNIEVDVQGPASGEPLLLIMGLGMQLITWPQELVDLLVARGFRVIRHDNRDAGLSQHFDAAGVPNLPLAAMRHALGLRVNAPYTVADMAADAFGVLDALGIRHAHVCGASMGGMIAQHMAVRQPARVKSLTLVMTTSGARHLPQAGARVRAVLMSRPSGHDADAVLAHMKRVVQVVGSPAYRAPPERLHAKLLASFQRSYRPRGTVRQLVAIAADGDRSAMLARIGAPTQVVHGRDDALVPVAAAHDLVRKIAGAQADIIDGMGHDLPLELLPRIAQGIAAAASRATA